MLHTDHSSQYGIQYQFLEAYAGLQHEKQRRTTVKKKKRVDWNFPISFCGIHVSLKLLARVCAPSYTIVQETVLCIIGPGGGGGRGLATKEKNRVQGQL